MLKIRRSEVNFIFVGCLGFFVDVSVFNKLNDALGFLCSRLISFTISTFICWLLNRNFTFDHSRSGKVKVEGFSYYAVALASAVINIATSYYLNQFPNYIGANFAIAFACIIAASFNFLGLKKFVYKYGSI